MDTVKVIQDLRKDKVTLEINERVEPLMFGLGIKTKTQAIERLLDEFAKEDPEVFKTRSQL